MDGFSNVQIQLEEIPSLGELNYVPLERKYLNILLLNSLLVFIISIVLLVYLWTVIDKQWFQNNFQWMLVGLLALFVLQFLFAYKSFSYKAYGFREADITYKSGWLWRSITTVPFNRVQHCEVSQGVLDRYFGLAKLKIFTAGGSASDVSIPGLLLDQASDLKEFILEKIKTDE
ncbi:PH domain-containing protein [Portibacter lacus]|uniref:YdbS-like PH domain-containing protein n=1 Tax=Portibacter lacus TaxID=1099794 RepID=A0AA37WD80_9BACT|nr:PH domain-containing protein [Portibacter lacus]GLR17651.1 hypothetical protein GCM10007940_22660 [Portibacter lacus]